MYNNDNYERGFAPRENSEDVYSKPVRAGKRTYFFDVKATKGNNDHYLTITESKRRTERDGSFTFDKHKIFLYKEDFDKFVEGLQDAIAYIKQNFLSEEGGPAAPADDVSFEEL
ncbi:MAG: DUF3276 family protein [Bacteroidales bacterium]|jgi:hypothetical protein|nr:DUF3276 family protein [Bacteroidales bacterium]